MDPTLTRLQQWYTSQCDGEWEHGSGIKIETLDNPGWLIQINLAGTDLEGKIFEPVFNGLGEESDGLAHPESIDWHSITVKANVFEAAGDTSKLAFLLETFLDWASRHP